MQNHVELEAAVLRTIRIAPILQVLERCAQRNGVVFGLFLFLSYLSVGLPAPQRLWDSLFTLGGQYYPLFRWMDSAYSVWDYAWWPHAILNGLNPFKSDYLWFPHETNLARVQSIPTLALLASPLTAAFGPVVSYNVVQFLTPALNSFCAFLLMRTLSGNRLACIVGAYVFGFSPYVMGHLPIHAALSFVAPIPLAVSAFIKWHRGSMATPWFVVNGALAVATLGGVSLETLAFGAVAAALALAVFIDRINFRAIGVLAAVAVVASLLMSPLIYFFLQSSDGSVPVYLKSGADLLYIFLPLPYELFHANVDAFGMGLNIPETTTYLGPFVIALLVYFRRAIGLRLLLLFAVLFAISLGTNIVIFNVKLDVINPLGYLVSHIPLLDHGLLPRFSVFAYLVLGVIFLKISEAAFVPNRERGVAVLVTASILSFLPNPTFGTWIGLHSDFAGELYSPVVPGPFWSDAFRAELDGKVFISLPFESLGELAQAVSGMKFKLVGAYTGNYYPGGTYPRRESDLFGPLQPWLEVNMSKDWATRLAQYCVDSRIDGVLYDPSPWAPTDVPDALLASGWTAKTFEKVMLLYPPGAKAREK